MSLKSAREQAGLSQNQLAKQADVSAQTISWNNASKLAWNNAVKLASESQTSVILLLQYIPVLTN